MDSLEIISEAYDILAKARLKHKISGVGNLNHINTYLNNKVEFEVMNSLGREFLIQEKLASITFNKTKFKFVLSFTEKGFWWFTSIYNLKNNPTKKDEQSANNQLKETSNEV